MPSKTGSNPALLHAIRVTFDRRNTHPAPTELSAPPPLWKDRFIRLAQPCGLSDDMDGAFVVVKSFLNDLSVENAKGTKPDEGPQKDEKDRGEGWER